MSKEEFALSNCPTCGSPDIRKVEGPWKGTFQGKAYAVPGLVYFSCPVCEEKVCPPDAMRKIQEASPANPNRSR